VLSTSKEENQIWEYILVALGLMGLVLRPLVYSNQTEQLSDEKAEVFIQQNMLLCNLNTLFLRHRLNYTHQLQPDWPVS